MKEYNTAKRDYLKTQTTLSSDNIYDLEENFLLENGYEDWRAYFYAFGYTDAYTNNLSSLWWRWLTSKGFTRNNLRGKFYDFYTDGSVNL
jgi:hypothetical protein